jgi:hypothetical protein
LPPANIAFLFGCAEPGKDGVGDYVALLAAECNRRGHPALRIALSDPFITGAAQRDDLLRLGSRMDWIARAEQARGAVQRFGADIVSLQWVPYSFHPKGIPRGIRRGLAEIAAGRPVHLMCHELWIGAEIGATWRSRLIGAAQRSVLRRIVRALRPAIIHTSNPAYATLLNKAGIQATVLPLFGSIPITAPAAPSDSAIARFGMFGALHPEWPSQSLLARLRSLGRPISIEHIGRIGRGEGTWREMEQRYSGDFAFKRHGEQPPARISQFLMEMDFGIATTPLALLGKSATATAMLEHGLPVIAIRDDIHYPGIHPAPIPEGVIPMSDRFIDALRHAIKRQPCSRLPSITDQFLATLPVQKL